MCNDDLKRGIENNEINNVSRGGYDTLMMDDYMARTLSKLTLRELKLSKNNHDILEFRVFWYDRIG